MVTDANANLEARHDYLPFGLEIPTGYGGRGGATGASDGVTARFTGQELDTETGLYHFPARYLGSAQGRFTSPDPAGNAVADPSNPQSWNLYSYVFNNPLALVDPSGLDPSGTDACISLIDSACAASDLFNLNGAWWGPDQSLPPPDVPPPATPMPNPTTGPWGSPGGNGFLNCSATLTGCPPGAVNPAQQTQVDVTIARALGVILWAAGGPLGNFVGGNVFVYVMEKTGGPWDFKNQPYQGAHPELDDFGNCHYGAVSRAVGLPDGYARWAAGLASYNHYRAKGKNPPASYGRPWSGPPWGDNPQNQAQIQVGQRAGTCN